jgi:hypothetical protein
MKRDRTNHKIEYYLEKGRDCLESCYSQKPGPKEERIALLEDPEGYFKRSLRMANSAEKLIFTLPDENFRKDYENRAKDLKCRIFKFSTEYLMMLAGESASNMDIESTSRYVSYALNSQKYARRYGPAPKIELKELESMERVAKRSNAPLPSENNILDSQAEDLLRERSDQEVLDVIEKNISETFPDGLPEGYCANIIIRIKDDKDNTDSFM